MSWVLAVLVLLGQVDQATIHQTIICRPAPCPSCPCPPIEPFEPLSSDVVLEATEVRDPTWWNLRSYARLASLVGESLTPYYRSRQYELSGSYRHTDLYEICLEPGDVFLGESCTVIRTTVLLRVRIHSPQTHPYDRNVNNAIDLVDHRYFVRCWHGLNADLGTDVCDGTVGITLDEE